jgi:hypothetical protein
LQIFLEFDASQSAGHRARLVYAFRLFCAIYGHQPRVEASEAGSADCVISYLAGPHSRPTVQLGNHYRPRPLSEPAPAPSQFEHHGEKLFLIHFPTEGSSPDWLGEIFEWVSCADEYSVGARDAVGRVPFARSYVGRHNLNVQVPYAAVAMRWLQLELCRLMPAAPVAPSCPAPTVSHFVIPSHDVDFFPVGTANSFWRLAKNAAISLSLFRDVPLAMKQAGAAVRAGVGGKNSLDQMLPLADREARQGIEASYYFLPRRVHRRDGNYLIDQPEVLNSMRTLEAKGMEVGVHGSYSSLDQPDGLASEFACLQQHGFKPQGSRQHWLRFTLDRIIPALETAGAVYDTSLGWSERIGFRGGACFAFPPYDFAHERAARFLEIPMVVMEVTLRRLRQRVEDLYREVCHLLAVSRQYGWGGISVLWHPAAFGGGQLPDEIGELYWRLADSRTASADYWTSAATFMDAVGQRYRDVGLLTA